MIDMGALLNRLDQLETKVFTSRDFLPRSCFELKATNPSAPCGVYSIDPDGQIVGGDPPIQVYCDMATRNNKPIINYKMYKIDPSSLYIKRDHIHLSRH